MQTITGFIRGDHEIMDTMINDFIETQEGFDELKAKIERHVHWEDDILFPIFDTQADSPCGTGPTDVMRSEHVQVTGLLADIESNLTDQDKAVSLAKELDDLMALHTQKEEMMLFPLIDNALTGQEVTDLITQLEAA